MSRDSLKVLRVRITIVIEFDTNSQVTTYIGLGPKPSVNDLQNKRNDFIIPLDNHKSEPEAAAVVTFLIPLRPPLATSLILPRP